MAQEKRSIIYEITFKGTEDQQQKLSDLRKTIEELTFEKKKLLATDKAYNGTNEEVRKSLDKVNQSLRNEKKESSVIQREIDNVTKANKSAAGSYNELSAKLGIAKSRLKEMSAEQRKTAEGKALQSEVKNTSAELQKLDKQGGVFSRNVGNYFGAVKSAAITMGAGIVAAFSVRAISGFLKSSLEAYDKQVSAEKSLQVALGGTSKALLEQAAAIQHNSEFGDESIIQGQAYLAQMRLTEDQIKQITPAIVDFAAAQKMDVEESFKLMGKSLGSSTNALKRYGVEIKGAVGSSERLNSAVTNLNTKFKGQAEAMASVGMGAVRQLGNAWGDLKEKVGGFVAKAILPAVKGMKNFVEITTEYIGLNQTEKIRSEQDELNNLVYSITQVNNDNEYRNKLIKELNIKYPEFLANINQENISNETLSQQLTKVNEQYSQKLLFIQYEEKINENLEKQKEAYNRQLAAQQKMTKAYTNFMKIAYDANAAAAGAIDRTTDWAEKFKIIEKSFAGIGGTGEKVLNLKSAYEEFNKSYKITTDLVSKSNLELAEEAIRNASMIDGAMSLLPESILKIGKSSKDTTIALAVQTEMLERQAESAKIVANNTTDLKNKSTEYLESISEGEGILAEQAKAELKRRKDLSDAAEKAWQKELKIFEQRQALVKSEFELFTKTEQEKTYFEAKQLMQRATVLKARGKITVEEYQTMYNQALKLQVDFYKKQRADKDKQQADEDKQRADEDKIQTDEEAKFHEDNFASRQALRQSNFDLTKSDAEEEAQFNLEQAQREFDDLKNNNKFKFDEEQIYQNKILGLTKDVTEAKEKTKQDKIQQTSDTFGALSNLAKSFGEKQKGFVLAGIALDTAAAISAATSSSAKNPLNPVTFGAAGTVQFIQMLAQIMANIMAAKNVLSQAKFAQGGITDGGIFKGRSHATGGIPIEVEGGESIINKKSTGMFAPLLSVINQIGGGRAFADGGFVQRSITQPIINNVFQTNEMQRMLESMPPQYVTVEDINAGLSGRNKIITRAIK